MLRPLPQTIWPRSPHVYAILGLVMGVAIGISSLAWQVKTLKPLQKYYIGTYLRCQFLPVNQNLSLIQVLSPKGPIIAIDPWVRPTGTGKQKVLLITPEGLQAGMRQPSLMPLRRVDPGKVKAFLVASIYGGIPLAETFKYPLWFAGIVSLIGLFLGIRIDRRNAKRAHEGVQVRGPILRNPVEAAGKTKGNGVALWLEPRSKLDREQIFKLALNREAEGQSALVVGDSGTGKTTLQRGFLHQIQARGETAIVHDPHGEFTEEFYRPERGDVILNPLDTRFPFWSPGLEVEKGNEAEGLMLGQSLYPVLPYEQAFFKQQASSLFAFLVAYHQPSGNELGEMMANDEVLDEMVKGTEFERTLTKDSAAQRSGIVSTLNLAGPAFRLLPDTATNTFSTKEWAKTRKGWIFISNTTSTREALYPLQSMWVDLLIARLLDLGQPKGLPFTWMFLDELAAFQHLPKLKLGITEGRKAGLSLFLGFHGKSQIEGIYGKDADTLFALPRTKIFLRTAEEGAAKWASGMIGEVEMMRVRESRPAHEFMSKGRGHNFSVERTLEPLVLYSTIMRLDDMHGYLSYENMAVPITLAKIPKTIVAPRYIPAPIRQRWFAADTDATETSEATPKEKPKSPTLPPGKPPSPAYGIGL